MNQLETPFRWTVLTKVRETTLHGLATQAQYIYQHSLEFQLQESQIKGIHAELADFLTQLVQNLVLYTLIHSFVVIRSQHLKWQKQLELT